jgi:DNA helicase-2/ATP-dependent DNA helicase PcrA
LNFSDLKSPPPLSPTPATSTATIPLSRSKRKAVTDTGVQLILAGPGSGKTRVITEKILHLIQKGVKPENIAALIFSDKAAHEMLERLEKQTNTSDLTISTFHAFALSVLQENVLDSGLSFPAVNHQPGQPAGVGLEHIEVGNNTGDVIPDEKYPFKRKTCSDS